VAKGTAKLFPVPVFAAGNSLRAAITVDAGRRASQAKVLTIPLRPGGRAAAGDPETASRPRGAPGPACHGELRVLGDRAGSLGECPLGSYIPALFWWCRRMNGFAVNGLPPAVGVGDAVAAAPVVVACCWVRV
jgi:hypothetical protein